MCEDPSEAYNIFNDLFHTVIRRHLRIKTFTRTQKSIKRPWITKGLFTSIHTKHKLFSKMKNHPRNNQIKNKYTRYRNTLTKLLRLAKKNYYTNKISNASGNTNKTWLIIKEMLNKTHTKCSPDKLTTNNPGNTCLTDTRDITQEFNNYFTGIGPNLAQKITSNKDFRQYLDGNYLNSFFFHPVSEEDVLGEIFKLDPRKATGQDTINPLLVIHAAHIIACPLTHIINCSLNNGIFPSLLKIAKVIPIYKKGSPCDVGNYRPISILPVISKVFESIVNHQLVIYFEKYNILIKTQFGFRKKHSTKLALVDLITGIANKLDNGYLTCGIFIDLRKAFDTIDHSILLQKLSHYGVRGLPLLWFKSYLSQRKQCVCINNVTSPYSEIQCGVPQGSILGPLLFLIYINDIVNATDAFEFRLFADDTNLFQFINNPSNIIQLDQLHFDFRKVCDWCDANRLTINVEKTNFMIIKTSQRLVKTEGSLGINRSQISQVTSTNYLGVCLDQNMLWTSHIEKVRKAISPINGIISKIRYYVPKSTLLLLYNSMILPHISYCIEIWGNTYNTFLKPILNLQKKVIRFITFSNIDAPSSPLFQQLGILNVHQQCKFNTSLFIFDLRAGHFPQTVNDYFNTPPNTYHTRNTTRDNFYIPKVNLTLTQHNFQYAAAKHWNSLPEELKKIQSRTTFKSQLKQYLLQN